MKKWEELDMEIWRRKEFKKAKKKLLKMWKERKKWYMGQLKSIEVCQKTATSDLKYLNERDIQERIELLNCNEKIIMKLLEYNIEWNNSMNETVDNLVSIYFNDEQPEEDIVKEVAKESAAIDAFSQYVKEILRIRKEHNDSVIAIFQEHLGEI